MEERFDILDGSGAPVGQARPRSEVHARGLWHRAFHLFLVARLDGVPHALLQRRSEDKDTSPGKLDVAVGGHFSAGETIVEAVREVEEELGLRVSVGELTFLWTQAVVHETPQYVDREHQEVYLLRRDAPPEAYRPDPVELAGLYAAPLGELEAVLAGTRAVGDARGLARVGRGPRAPFVADERSFTRADFIAGDEERLLRAVRASVRAFESQ